MSSHEMESRSTLSALCIRRPVLTLVMSFFILVLGAVSFRFLGIREFPAVNPPSITVTTSYSGASADIIETQITEPIEASINGVDGIRSLNSVSREGRSQVTVEFDIATDLDAAANDVRDRVSRVVRQLPADADPPSVAKADANSFPIIVVTVQSDTRDILEVNAIGTQLKERLETIPGVAEVRIWGERKFAMRILFDPYKLSSRNLTLDDVRLALKQENLQLPSGRIEGPQVELTVMAPPKLATPEAVSQVILRTSDQGVVRLGDVARVVLGAENERSIMRVNGVPMVGLALISQPNANALEIAHTFYTRFEQLKKESPADVKLALGFDSTRFIERSILEVRETIAIAFVLVLLVLFFFLRSWRSALIPALAIPISLVGGFFVMYFMGFTINVLTLLALVLAIGLVVDDAIVVLEAIYSRVERGEDPMSAGFKGSQEIFFAIVATTMVLVAIFMPIVFLGGFTGRLFREFGIVLAGSVLISAFVSLTLTPMLSARLLRKPGERSLYHRTEPLFEAMVTAYKNSLEAFLRIRLVAIAVILLTLLGTVWLGATLKTELAPLEDRNALSILATAPEGTSYNSMDATMVKLSERISTLVPEASVIAITAPAFVSGGGSNGGFMRLLLTEPENRARTQQQIATEMNGPLRGMSDMRAFVNQDQTIQIGSRAGLPVQFVIEATSFEPLREALPKFLEAARKDPTFAVVDENLKFNRPQIKVEVDRDRARALGTSVGEVAQALQLAYGETRLDYYIQESRQYFIIGLLDKPFRDEPSDLLAIPVRTRSGGLVPLSSLVHLKEVSGPPQLYRTNRYVSATVSAALAPGKTLGEGIDAMRRAAKESLNPSFGTELSGPSRDFAESKSSLFFAFIMALIMVYLALAAQFESFRHPFTVMLTVPLALFGALLTLKLTGQTLNIFSEIGLIMLIGLVTKNGILIVEFANQRREQGLPLREAILAASATRFRPIIMTSLTTVLGTLPIALGLGAGSQSRVPMGVAVVGGLVFSLILTLYVIPAMYTYLAGKVVPLAATLPKLSILFLAALLTLVFPNSTQAQDTMLGPKTLRDALQFAQDHNPSVKAEQEVLRRLEADVSWYTAELWPKVEAVGGVNQSVLDTRQRRLGASADSVKNGAVTTGYTAGINGTWTLFEGLKTPALRSQLILQRDMAALRLEEVKVDLSRQTAEAYYAVLRDRELMLASDTLTDLISERLRLVKARRASGAVSRQEELEAEADYLAQQAGQVRAKSSLMASWQGFAVLLGRQDGSFPELALDLVDPGDPVLRDIATLQATGAANTIEMKRANLIGRLADAGWKIAVSELFPKLSVSAGYTLALTRSQAGLVAYNESLGPSIGAQVKFNLIPLVALHQTSTKAQATLRETEIRKSWILAQVHSDLNRGATMLKGCQEALELEKRNRVLAAEAVQLMQQRLQSGAVSQVEAHMSEERFVSAIQKSIDQLYECRKRDLDIVTAANIPIITP